MRPEVKTEIGCWLAVPAVPISLLLIYAVLSTVFGNARICTGVYAGTCSPVELAINGIGMILGGFALFIFFLVPIYLLLLLSRLAYLLIKRVIKR